jgi:subtilase family serine protease
MRGRYCSAAVAGLALAALSAGVSIRGGAASAGVARVDVHPAVMLPADRFVSAAPPTTAQCEAALKIRCYQPFQLQKAYDLNPLYQNGYDGSGKTIAIVDSYGSPTIGRDLARFDRDFNLPPPPSFVVIQPAGPVPAYRPTGNRIGWAFETSLDVEWAHAIAPGANILLVETPVAETEGTVGFPQIVKAENYVIDHQLGDVISQSFGATEETFPSAQSLLDLRSAYINAAKHHVSVLAGTGDEGATNFKTNGSLYLHPVSSWPDTDPLVTAVGGTLLHLDSQGNRISQDTVYNDTNNVAVNEFIFGNAGPNANAAGGGTSIIFNRPQYQNDVEDVVGDARGVPDISMSGDCAGAVDVFLSFKGLPAGYYLVCGTSESTPLFAGVIAIADQFAKRDLGLLNPALYDLADEDGSGIVDVTRGNLTVSFTQNGSLHTVHGPAAKDDYDLASGLGTVDAAKLVRALADRD